MILHGDCLDLMATMDPNSVDAICTDPPYGLSKEPDIAEVLTHWLAGDDYQHSSGGFMGKSWDSFVPGPSYWKAAYRVMKPGAHLVAFGGTRTVDLLTIALRIAGFEIRDSLVFLQGQGFPKSLDVSKAIDKIKDRSKLTALSHEIKRARAESELSLAEIGQSMQDATDGQYGKWYHRGGHMFFETGMNLPSRPEWEHLRHVLPINESFFDVYDEAEREVIGHHSGVPGMTKDKGWNNGPFSRGEAGDITAPATPEAEQWQGWHSALKPGHEPIVLARKPLAGKNIAANVLAYGTGAINVDKCRIEGGERPHIENAGRANAGVLAGSGNKEGSRSLGRTTQGCWPANVILDETAAGLLDAMSGERAAGGYPARSNSQPGSNGKTMNGGWHGKDSGVRINTDTGGASRFYLTAPIDDPDAEHTRFMYVPKASRAERSAGLNTPSNHPTVKPISLMRWLVRLVTPPGGVILDPFTGSGSTGCAAALEGFAFIGIEQDAEYVEIARARIAHWTPKAAPQLALALETVDTPASKGRWPANVLLDETAAALLDEQSGVMTASFRRGDRALKTTHNQILGKFPNREDGWNQEGAGYTDTGGASRFFFTAHADQEEEAS